MTEQIQISNAGKIGFIAVLVAFAALFYFFVYPQMRASDSATAAAVASYVKAEGTVTSKQAIKGKLKATATAYDLEFLDKAGSKRQISITNITAGDPDVGAKVEFYYDSKNPKSGLTVSQYQAISR
jgi:FlaG/FlaF family flagellin (archaellin)